MHGHMRSGHGHGPQPDQDASCGLAVRLGGRGAVYRPLTPQLTGRYLRDYTRLSCRGRRAAAVQRQHVRHRCSRGALAAPRARRRIPSARAPSPRRRRQVAPRRPWREAARCHGRIRKRWAAVRRVRRVEPAARSCSQRPRRTQPEPRRGGCIRTWRCRPPDR